MFQKIKTMVIDLFQNHSDEKIRPKPVFRKDRKVHFEVEGERCQIYALCGTKAFEVQTHADLKYVTCKKCRKRFGK